MKLFMLFLLTCLFIGMAQWRASTRKTIWMMLGLAVTLAFVYFFLERTV